MTDVDKTQTLGGNKMMDYPLPFWQRGFGRFIRWLLFLPVGCILLSILQSLPPLAVIFAANYKPEFSLLLLIILIIVVPMLGGIGWMWVVGVYFTPSLSCNVIAPNPQVGAVIFGTLFCLFQTLYILTIFFGYDFSWIFILYQVVFAGIVIGGTVMAYKES